MTQPLRPERPPGSERPWPTLVVVGSTSEPERLGEVVALSERPRQAPWLLGRSEEAAPGLQRALLARQRPGETTLTGPLRSPSLSRDQLEIVVEEGALSLRNLGRCPLRVGGEIVEQATVRLGDLVELDGQMLFRVVERPGVLPGVELGFDPSEIPFGDPDPDGLVGESPAMWSMRGALYFLAGRQGHVLVRGESGSGKELVARALHAASDRARGPWISRSAATLPETLVDAELFGNARNYPNPGMIERAGLVGDADRGTLFLDEFAELPLTAQAHLLRVLDAGEYTRLGESKPRRSDFRLVAATNRPDEAIKHDVLARFRLRLSLPPLSERREDIPLLAMRLLRAAADRDAAVARRVLPQGRRAPALGMSLYRALQADPFPANIRGLEILLWEAIARCTDGAPLDVAAPTEPPLLDPRPHPLRKERPATDPASLTAEQIRAALDANGGAQEPTWRALGLSSRFVLIRLMRKHGIEPRRMS